MEIHSSSLAFIPKRVESKKQNETQPSSPGEESFKKQVLSTPELLTKSEDSSNLADLELLSADIERLKKSSVNKQANRALNAYTQENIQPLKNQRSELVSSIDFYV